MNSLSPFVNLLFLTVYFIMSPVNFFISHTVFVEFLLFMLLSDFVSYDSIFLLDLLFFYFFNLWFFLNIYLSLFFSFFYNFFINFNRILVKNLRWFKKILGNFILLLKFSWIMCNGIFKLRRYGKRVILFCYLFLIFLGRFLIWRFDLSWLRFDIFLIWLFFYL